MLSGGETGGDKPGQNSPSSIAVANLDHNDGQFFGCDGMVNVLFRATIGFDGFSMVLTPLDH